MQSETTRFENAVKLENGELENFVMKVAGKPFRCDCGCNVFHKPDRARPDIYECNACGTWYTSD